MGGPRVAHFNPVAAAWTISKEPWMSSACAWINNLKVRAGWGIVGNDRITNYLSRDIYTDVKYGHGSSSVTVLVPQHLANPDLRWEGATTDKPTVVNLSNHTYFNLRGPEGCYGMEHILQVEADTCVQNTTRYCPDLLLPVDESPFDFRTPQRVDCRIDMPNEHLRIMKGMSACWVLRGWDGSLRKAANLYDPKSGRDRIPFLRKIGPPDQMPVQILNRSVRDNETARVRRHTAPSRAYLQVWINSITTDPSDEGRK